MNALEHGLLLTNLSLPEDLDTSVADVEDILLNPCLSRAITYDRGVGYFSSAWLRRVASGLSKFAERNGKMRLVTSPHLNAEDWAALRQGNEARTNEAIMEMLRPAIIELAEFASEEPVQMLAWMIADELLDVKIAIPTGKLDGDYHPKMGSFTDAEGNQVVFHGSQNETDRGFRNFETLDIFCSWLDSRDQARINNHQTRFERIWSGHDPHVRTYDLPAALKRNLAEFTKGKRRPYNRETKTPADRKWRHQDEALACFLEKRAGILAMATGTGKTKTALKIDRELHQRELVVTTIVAAYGTDLLDQWYSEILAHNHVDLILREYDGHHEATSFRHTKRSACLLVNRRNLADIINRMDEARLAKTFVICDEVHGFGEANLVASLTNVLRKVPYRLGLSATPTREYDLDGNNFIEQEIGPVIYRFEIHEAIRRGILCELDYHPLEFAYSAEDRSAAQSAWARQSAREKEGTFDRTQLYMDLAKVKKLSKEKIPVFEAFAAANPDIFERAILFVEQADYGALLQPLLVRKGISYHTYYGDDDRGNLKRFADGELDCIIACKRISEGIDIQTVRNIVLFSTARAPIETVQRVGRCLRIDPKDPTKRAQVVDFIKIEDGNNASPNSGPMATDQQRRDWFETLAETKFVGDAN